MRICPLKMCSVIMETMKRNLAGKVSTVYCVLVCICYYGIYVYYNCVNVIICICVCICVCITFLLYISLFFFVCIFLCLFIIIFMCTCIYVCILFILLKYTYFNSIKSPYSCLFCISLLFFLYTGQLDIEYMLVSIQSIHYLVLQYRNWN